MIVVEKLAGQLLVRLAGSASNLSLRSNPHRGWIIDHLVALEEPADIDFLISREEPLAKSIADALKPLSFYCQVNVYGGRRKDVCMLCCHLSTKSPQAAQAFGILGATHAAPFLVLP